MSAWPLPFIICVLHCIENAKSDKAFVGVKLGEKCFLEKECQLTDPNSQCLAVPSNSESQLSYVQKCACKNNYKLQVNDRTQQCISVYIVDDEKDSGDFSAGPIIFCFVACIVVEVVCLLGFRYWRKQRMKREFRLREYQGTTSSTACTRACQSALLPVVTFGIMHPLSPILSGAGPTSPSTHITNVFPETRLPQYSLNSPPSYEEATKIFVETPNFSSQPNSEVSERVEKEAA